ncbi:MAG: AAA family ATPase [Paludibacteraceae bacterium]|nr:AAA family ATPase [Paludibacteraceae bacterium]
MIIGRKEEQQILHSAVQSDNSEFIAVYGRRRVGKTYLIRETFGYKFTFQHTGLVKGNTKEQLFSFAISLRDAGYDDCPIPKSWLEAFSLLSTYLKNSTDEKKIVFLDELPWMDTPRSNFISAFEHFWNGWASARKDIVLIICGSATSWIINKVINDHGGLHNRVTKQIALQPFTLKECEMFAQSKGLEMSRYQLAECYMVLGGIPYYWSLLEKGLSLAQNIDKIIFAKNGKLSNEFNQLYASLFKSPEQYIDIVTALGKKKAGMTREEIIAATDKYSNGALSKVLDELEYCGFIRKYNGFDKKSKQAIYQLIDNYTLFYFKFIQQNENNDEHFWSASIDSAMHRAWSGLAFERLCMAHTQQIKAALGIAGVLSNVYSWRKGADEMSDGAQIDLLIDRKDQVINLCEMKYSLSEYVIDAEYEQKLRNKKSVFIDTTNTRKAVHLTMVTTFGIKANAHSGIVQNEITLEDLFS